jgi:hypothetical protein
VKKENESGKAKGTSNSEVRGREKAAEEKSEAESGEKKASGASKPFRLTEATKRKLIRDLIQKISEQIQGSDKAGGSVADLTRLLQMEKELAPRRPRTITVVWEKPKDR